MQNESVKAGTNSLQLFAQSEYYHTWSCFLSSKILGLYFEKAVSFDKDTLFVHFKNADSHFTLEIKFIDGFLFLFESERATSSRDQHKGILQFRGLESKEITAIISNKNDRYLAIELSHSKVLWLKGFGKFGNVLLYDKQENAIEQIFKLGFKSDWEFQIPSLDDSYFIKENKYSAEYQKKFEVFQQRLSESLRAYFFDYQKSKMIKELSQRIKHIKAILDQSEKRIYQIETRRSNKELGDLILAHAHSLKPGLSQALITDYYTQQRIRIKLNPDLSAAENAKKYYGKAKNEVIERQKLKQTISLSSHNLGILESQLETVNACMNMKELRSISITKNSSQKDNKSKIDNLPYKLFDFSGFQIWVGKNNKSNDEMLKLSSKNDLWLHAKDCTGSHVIIKKKGLVFPKEVIEFAAKLAAQHSKSKHQSIVPVIFTERKFITKSKNMNAGEVNVLKEQIIDAHLDK